MSYNITRWITKELVDLRIPVASLYKSEHKSWHPRRINHDDGTVTFETPVGDGTEIIGTIEDDILAVNSFEAYGEGSGTAVERVLIPALEDSDGTLTAVLVWEGGDCIERLTVVHGNVTTMEIEL